MNLGSSWRHRAAGIAFLPLFVVCLSSCGGRPSQPPPQDLTFWYWGPAEFADDLTAVYNRSIPNVRVGRQLDRGSESVVTALHEGRADLGVAQADVAYMAYRRGTEHARHPHDKLRGIAVLWANSNYVVVRRDSAFHSIRDLRGKRIGVPTRDLAGEFVTRVVLRAHGMEYSDVQPVFQAVDKTLLQLQAGELDAAIVIGPGLPNGGMAELKNIVGVRLLPIDNVVANKLRATYPFFKRVVVRVTELSAEDKNGKDDKEGDKVETVGVDTLLVCGQHLSEELVYLLTKQFFAALPQLADKYAEAALVDTEQASTTPIPLHAGAARYYRELEILR